MSKEVQGTKIESKTIPIPDPPGKSASRSPVIPPGFGVEPPVLKSRGRRTYSVEELLSLREKNQDSSDIKLPDKINRNLLEPAARKRKYPFVTENQRRKTGDSSNSRWEGKQGKWRDKHRKDINLDELVDEDEHDEERDPNEPDPDWADVDEEKIKRDIANFQFQALDREAEREMFAQTGSIPDKPKLAPKEAKTTQPNEKNIVNSLFRQAANNAMPQLPENAVDANQLEKNGNTTSASLFGPGLDSKRKEDDPLIRPLGGLFEFAGFSRDSSDTRDEMRGFGSSELRNGDLSRPIGNHLGDRGREEYGRTVGERSPIGAPRSPNQSHAQEDPNRIADYDLNVTTRINDPGADNRDPRKGSSDSPAHETESGPRVQYDSSAKPKPNQVKSNTDPIQRLDNILYEITDPVRPCVGGQFFAAARPLTNKELYDYSPKFKEIQDRRLDSMRHKQMMRHSMNQQRKRIMMAKYAQAKQMYEKYPAKYGGPDGHRSRMIDYRRNEYEYMKRPNAGPGMGRGDFH